MKNIKCSSYTQYKDIVFTTKELIGKHQHLLDTIDDKKYYYLFSIDGSICYECFINEVDNQSDVTDYETNYSSTANSVLNPFEAETGLPKTKPRPVEGTLHLCFAYFTTNDANSLDVNGSEHWSMSVVSGETTNLSKVRLSPCCGYYIEGGGLKVIGTPPTEYKPKATFIMAPDIPEDYGGNVHFVRNKKFNYENEAFTLETPPKYIKYYGSGYASYSEIELQVEHGQSDQVKFEFFTRIYK